MFKFKKYVYLFLIVITSQSALLASDSNNSMDYWDDVELQDLFPGFSLNPDSNDFNSNDVGFKRSAEGELLAIPFNTKKAKTESHTDCSKHAFVSHNVFGRVPPDVGAMILLLSMGFPNDAPCVLDTRNIAQIKRLKELRSLCLNFAQFVQKIFGVKKTIMRMCHFVQLTEIQLELGKIKKAREKAKQDPFYIKKFRDSKDLTSFFGNLHVIEVGGPFIPKRKISVHFPWLQETTKDRDYVEMVTKYKGLKGFELTICVHYESDKCECPDSWTCSPSMSVRYNEIRGLFKDNLAPLNKLTFLSFPGLVYNMNEFTSLKHLRITAKPPMSYKLDGESYYCRMPGLPGRRNIEIDASHFSELTNLEKLEICLTYSWGSIWAWEEKLYEPCIKKADKLSSLKNLESITIMVDDRYNALKESDNLRKYNDIARKHIYVDYLDFQVLNKKNRKNPLAGLYELPKLREFIFINVKNDVVQNFFDGHPSPKQIECIKHYLSQVSHDGSKNLFDYRFLKECTGLRELEIGHLRRSRMEYPLNKCRFKPEYLGQLLHLENIDIIRIEDMNGTVHNISSIEELEKLRKGNANSN